jgi:hypothetical protein
MRVRGSFGSSKVRLQRRIEEGYVWCKEQECDENGDGGEDKGRKDGRVHKPGRGLKERGRNIPSS